MLTFQETEIFLLCVIFSHKFEVNKIIQADIKSVFFI